MPRKKMKSAIVEPGVTARMSSSDFIRSLPPEMPVAEVIAKGKAVGLKMGGSLVYGVRSAQKNPKGPPKRRGRPPRQGAASAKTQPSKSDFIRSMPDGLPAGEVVAKAKAAGIAIDNEYVYKIRRMTRGRARGKMPGAARATPKIAIQLSRAVTQNRVLDSLEGRFVAIVLDLGLARASELLEQLKARVRAIVL